MAKPASTGAATRPKVLYLGGAGRSGSTLLARLLGRVPGFAAVGELRYIWERGFVENHLCECGEPFRQCPFWHEVAADAFGGFEGIDVTSLRREMREIDRIRHVPQLLSSGLQSAAFRRRLVERGEVLERLYASVCRISGQLVVIDSSKDASYAFVLHAIGSVDLAVVHLVRDSRAVAHSWTRVRNRPEIHWRRQSMMQRAPMSSARSWDTQNLLYEVFQHTNRPFARVRYEDLVAQPADVLSTVTSLSRLPVATSGRGVRNDEPRHSISGNPMRFDRAPLQVRLDDEWVSAMSGRDRGMVTVATAPLLAKYGYLPHSTRCRSTSR